MAEGKFVGAGSEVSRPEPTPLTSSVLDHARAAGNVHEITGGFGYRNNEGLWPSYNCLDLLVPTPICPDPLLDETGSRKTFDAATWQPGFTFAVYGGAQCRAIGLDVQNQDAEIRRVFDASQGKGIERALASTRFVASVPPGSDEPASPYYGQWDAPQDVTPGAPIPLHVALALLEGYAAANYVGQPTIHMPMAAVSMLNERIIWRDGLAYTRSGSKVAAGGGYDETEIHPNGEWDLYATGEVYVEMSEQISLREYVLPGMADNSSDGSGLIENGVVTLAERMFRVAVDCFTAKVTAKVWTL